MSCRRLTAVTLCQILSTCSSWIDANTYSPDHALHLFASKGLLRMLHFIEHVLVTQSCMDVSRSVRGKIWVTIRHRTIARTAFSAPFVIRTSHPIVYFDYTCTDDEMCVGVIVWLLWCRACNQDKTRWGWTPLVCWDWSWDWEDIKKRQDARQSQHSVAVY